MLKVELKLKEFFKSNVSKTEKLIKSKNIRMEINKIVIVVEDFLFIE
jgi:hypothetical protein